MFSTKTVKRWKGRVYIAHCGSTDVSWKYVSFFEKYNPFRYEIGINLKRNGPPLFWINRNGKINKVFKNFVYKIKKTYKK